MRSFPGGSNAARTVAPFLPAGPNFLPKVRVTMLEERQGNKSTSERKRERELESKNDRKVFTCESLRLSRRTSETIVFLSCSSFSPAHASGIWLFSFARPFGRWTYVVVRPSRIARD